MNGVDNAAASDVRNQRYSELHLVGDHREAILLARTASWTAYRGSAAVAPFTYLPIRGFGLPDSRRGVAGPSGRFRTPRSVRRPYHLDSGFACNRDAEQCVWNHPGLDIQYSRERRSAIRILPR